MQTIDTAEQQARQSAQAHMGEFAWPTVILGIVVAAGYVATALAVAGESIAWGWGGLLMALLTYAGYTVLHEAVHGSISGGHKSLRWVNELMGYLAAWILMIPMTAHRHEHLAHHRNTNQPGADPDHLVAGMTRSPLAALLAIVRSLVSQYRYYFKHRWGQGPAGQDLRFCLEIAAAIVPRLVFMAQGLWFEGTALILVGTVGGALLTVYLFAFLVHRPHTAVGRYVDTSTILVRGWTGSIVTVLWGFQNYHSIHHLFPRVPFYRYPEVFDEIETTMIAMAAPIYTLGLHGLESDSSHPAIGRE